VATSKQTYVYKNCLSVNSCGCQKSSKGNLMF